MGRSGDKPLAAAKEFLLLLQEIIGIIIEEGAMDRREGIFDDERRLEYPGLDSRRWMLDLLCIIILN